MTDVLKEALALKEYCTGCRQTVHQNPELSFQEFQTTAFIRRQLEEMGVEILPLELETGLVAIIRGGLGDGPVTGLRADIDALPLTEESGVPIPPKILAQPTPADMMVMWPSCWA